MLSFFIFRLDTVLYKEISKKIEKTKSQKWHRNGLFKGK